MPCRQIQSVEKVSRGEVLRERGRRVAGAAVVQEVVGTLLGQGFTGQLSTSRTNRVLVAAWLVFAFIVGTAYRGNLTASLTLPRYPPRPETVEELVNTVDSRAHMDTRQYLELRIAKQFTLIDGSSQIYIGQEKTFPSTSAWPIPHDAPYKANLDHYIMAITEAGLYEKWRKDLLREAERKSRERKRKILKEQQQEMRGTLIREDHEGRSRRALTITHMQGPLMIFLIGLVIGAEIFATEKLIVKLSVRHIGQQN